MHDHFAFQYLVGQSHWTEHTRRRIVQASRYTYSVLITGPQGTGKDLIARAIHAHSPRADRPVIPFRCGTLPAALTSTQLFGHTSGAGPLARGAALGCVGAANGGTLLLHEVGDLDLAAQDRLLAVLMQRRARPVGAGPAAAVDLRVIATSSRDLGAAARAGHFRFRLLYALNAISISALPLCQRRADIAPLARHVIARFTFEQGLPYRPLTPSALALLEAHDWPGNVVELEQVVEQAISTSDGCVLDLEDFPELFATIQERTIDAARRDVSDGEPVNEFERVPTMPVVAGRWPSLEELESEHLRATLRRSGQNLTVAAGMLGLDRIELQAKLKRHGILLPGQMWPGQSTSMSDQPA